MICFVIFRDLEVQMVLKVRKEDEGVLVHLVHQQVGPEVVKK